MRRAHRAVTMPSNAGNATNDSHIAPGPESSAPGPGSVRPSSPGPSIASSQTRWDTGSSNRQTPSSPVATMGPTKSTENTAATTDACHPGMGTPGHTGHVKPTVWRPPIVAWAVLTATALAVNLVLGNRLWAWYAFTGLVASGIFLFLVRRFAWDIPDRLLWWAGVPLALHYIGGSLSGLHQVGGPNGLYHVFPWWDNVVHFLGAAAVGVVAAHVLLPHIRPRGLVVAMAVAAALSMGVLVELYEFVNFVWLGTVDQGYYTNTMLDLYYNGLGGAVAAWAYTRPPASRTGQPPSDPT